MITGNERAMRLMSKVVRSGDCLEYTGGVSSNGYGVFWMNGKSQNAHKASYILNVGDVPDGLWVLHKCDNKKCINPEHLYLGDRLDNTRDAVVRNRMAKGKNHGSKTFKRDFSYEKNPFAKLSKENCITIKNAIDSGVSKRWLAIQYKVHMATIYRAKYKADALIKELNKNQTT